MLRKLLLFTFLTINFSAFSQNYFMLRGFVFSETNEPLIGATIRIVNLNTGTITDEKGKYEIKVLEGINRVSVSNTGYKTEILEVVSEKDVVKNIFLKIDQLQLQEVVVRNKKRDYSYEVIKNVIENKQNFSNQYQNFKCETYIKSVEDVERKPVKAKVLTDEPPKIDTPTPVKKDTLPNLNLFECQLTRFESNSGQQKEEKLAVKKIGNLKSIFFKSITDGEFNLYKNHQKIAKIGDNEITSPISDLTFLSYKFKLLNYDPSTKIYKIKVSPREIGNALYKGEIEVLDGIWVLKSANLKLTKRALLLYDEFSFEQVYEQVANRWMPVKTVYHWKLKEGTDKKKGQTLVVQSKFEFDLNLGRRFFGDEVGSTKDDAYKKDSTFWDAIRPQPLSKTELAAVKAKEKLDILMSSKVYLDSIDKVFNRITFQKVLYQGIGHTNRAAKTNWNFAPLLGLIEPVAVGGFRVRYNLSYYKRYENRKQITVSPTLTYGLRNQDLKGNFSTSYFYNPKRGSNISVNFGRGFNVINGFATLNDLVRRSNFYENKYVSLQHRTEIINGLYINSNAYYEQRNDLSNFKFSPLGDKAFENNKPQPFANSQIFKTQVGLEYTPKQLYLREPNEKIILGSRYPTFSANLEKAWPVPGRNMSTYTYVSASMRQSFNIGVFGTSEYKLNIGKFLDTTRLAVMDYKYQRGGDNAFFSPAMYTFQLIPQTFPTFNWFFESHYVHQFNGFFTSKVPLLNKTGIREMAGAGFLYVPERKFQYSEAYMGFNRVFKIGRERLRIGGYYVVAQSNTFGLRNMFKISFEPYNQNRNTWSF